MLNKIRIEMLKRKLDKVLNGEDVEAIIAIANKLLDKEDKRN